MSLCSVLTPEIMTWGYSGTCELLEWLLDSTYPLYEKLIVLKSVVCNVCFVTQWKDQGLRCQTDACHSSGVE